MKTAPRYEIFRRVRKNTQWIETAASLHDAQARVKQLAATSPGHYFIFDPVNMDFISDGIAPECSTGKRYSPPVFGRIRIPPAAG